MACGITAVPLIGAVLLFAGVKSLNGLSHEYHFINDSKTWTAARRYCRERHTDLATVDNMSDMKVLRTVATGYEGGAWIGLQRGGVMRWQWSDGSGEPSYTNWRDTEPNNIDGIEECVSMTEEGTWNDVPCAVRKAVVCYNGPTSYTVHEGPLSWFEYQTHCRNGHIDLATVRDPFQNMGIREVAGGNEVWIGLFRDSWRWSDESGSSFRYWQSGKPDGDGSEGCGVSLLGAQGQWDDWPCDSTAPFFCHGPRKSKKSVVKMTILSNADLTDPVISDRLLQQDFFYTCKQWHAELTKQGGSDFQLSWRTQQDGQIFHRQEEEEEEEEGLIQPDDCGTLGG